MAKIENNGTEANNSWNRSGTGNPVLIRPWKNRRGFF